jgi:hypothetical protein
MINQDKLILIGLKSMTLMSPIQNSEENPEQTSRFQLIRQWAYATVLRPNLFDRSNPGLNGFQDTVKSVACHKKVTGNGSDQMDLNSSISFMELMLAR